MIIHELVGGSEADPVYQGLDGGNRQRQLDFLEDLVEAAIQSGTPFLSQPSSKPSTFMQLAVYTHMQDNTDPVT